jgi:hypothetical protein
MIVITGLDPVIHGLLGADRDDGGPADGRIKSGHDD